MEKVKTGQIESKNDLIIVTNSEIEKKEKSVVYQVTVMEILLYLSQYFNIKISMSLC